MPGAPKNVLVLSTEFGTENAEITVPVERLRALGHTVTVATPGGGDVQTLKGDRDLDATVPADARIDALEGAAAAPDVVLLPGGTLNADAARMDPGILAAVKAQAENGRAVAAICHAPWVLVEAGLARGKNLTSYASVRTDVENAGGSWSDESVVVCGDGGWTLVTSRTPDDLEDFVAAVDAL